MTFTCASCKTEFSNRHRRKFCSHACYSSSNKLANSNLEEKPCTSCLVLKARDDFYEDLRTASRMSAECKQCLRARASDRVSRMDIDRRRKYLESTRVYYRSRREEFRIKTKARNAAIRLRVLQAYGGMSPSCACCSESIVEFLSVDHINNDGAAHRKSIFNEPGARSFYRWLIKHDFPSGFQLLCHNCNRAKYIHGECPHKRSRQGELS